jgi:hypothetical protein
MHGKVIKFSHTKLSDIGTNTHAQIDTHVASTSNPHSTTKAQVGLGNVDNTSDSSKPVSTAQQTALDAKESTANKNQNNGYAGLDSSGKLNPSQLPAIAVTDTSVVASQTAMLALTAEVGDLAVRTDLNKTFILRVSPASTLGNWQELLTPTGAVASVYGRTGIVTAQSGDYTADQITETASNKILTSTERTKLSGIATGATANSTDAQLRDRSTHTGEQAISTITNLQTTLNLKLEAASIANFETTTQLNSRDTANRNRANHSGSQLASTISDFASTVLATVLTGLNLATSSVISATDTVLTALGKLQAQVTSLGSSKQDNLVSGTNIKTVNTQSILGSGNITIGGSAAWGGITGTLSTQTDLQSALNAKENSITAGTTSQYYRGDKTFQTLDKTAVGLGNVANTDTTTTANITDSNNKRFITDTQQTVLSNTSGTNTGDNATNTTSNTYADGKVADSITDGVTTSAPSQNAVFDALANKQATLVSGTSIKTINSQSILGSGNITISGGGGATDLAYVASSTDGVVTSSTGNSATIPAGSVTNASLMLPADKTKLDSITVDTATVVRKLVRNQTGSTIPKGTAVYQLGSSGIVITVAPADASLEATASQTLGITQEAIANNANGYVVAVGLLDGVNTSALTEGQIVWLSETAGQLTTTRPTQPAHSVVCGYCVKQGSGASGILYVKVDNGLELAELHDVLLTGAVTGNVLALFADGLWKPLALDKTSVGLGNVDNTSDANKPISTATQTALNAKQNTLVSATNIKTINGASVLGSGDLTVTGSGGISNNQSIVNALIFG